MAIEQKNIPFVFVEGGIGVVNQHCKKITRLLC